MRATAVCAGLCGGRNLCGIVRATGAPFVIYFPASQPIAGRLEQFIVIAPVIPSLLPGYFSPVLLKRSGGPAFECGYSRPLHWVNAHRAFLWGGQFSPGRTRARDLSLWWRSLPPPSWFFRWPHFSRVTALTSGIRLAPDPAIAFLVSLLFRVATRIRFVPQ